MTREEAEFILGAAGEVEDERFPLLEAAIACAIHDSPFRDAEPVRVVAAEGVRRLRDRLRNERSDDALTETLASDLRLNGDLLRFDDPANTDVIDVIERRRGLSAALAVFYIHIGREAGLVVQGVDFPGHFLVRVQTGEGPVAIDPFSEGRVVMPSELTRRALRAGLTPHVADRLDVLMAPVSDRQTLIRMQNILFIRAIQAGEFEAAERSAVRRALLEPHDHRPWLDVAQARERQGALAGALAALDRARGLNAAEGVVHTAHDRLRMRLN
ncbi:transglutaminase family protein [Brevundimonas balnearis]|uniref:Transglutaminase family protein n=1 Tax=Brevundimonas balnearis TaxID=1572858 RepID=A0ABV6R530_9CAUL